LETRQTLFVNNRLTHLFGYTLDDIRALGQDYFTQLLHPEDLSKLETWRKQAGELAEGKVLEIEYRFLHKDTSWKWVQAKEIVFKRHGDGSVWQMLGVLEELLRTLQPISSPRDNLF
jgi:PAS domain S-box-containing protein